MAKNRRVKESVHFYEHPAGTLRAGLQSSVYVVRMHRPSVRPGTSGQSDAQAKTDFLMRLSAAGQAQPSGLVDIPPDIPAQYCQGLAPYSSYAREVGYQPSKAGASYDGQNPSGSGSTGHHGPSRQSSQPSGPRMQSNEVLRQSGRPQIRPAAPPAQFGSGAGVVRPPPPYRPRPPPPPYRPQTSPRAPQPSGQPRHPGPGQHTAAPSVYHTGNDAQNTRPAKVSVCKTTSLVSLHKPAQCLLLHLMSPQQFLQTNTRDSRQRFSIFITTAEV